MGVTLRRWEFWIDVGGTFTDCIGVSPSGSLRRCKILSTLAHDDHLAEPSPIRGIRTLLELDPGEPIPACTLRLGTTRGTNALLTRTGARTLLVTTEGFADVLRIGNQDRPRLFDRVITKPEVLFGDVIEVRERIDASGTVILPMDAAALTERLRTRVADIDAVAVCFMNAYANAAHERMAAACARDAGVGHISISSDVAPTMGFIARGDTTVLDAYLNPILESFIGEIRRALGSASEVRLMTSRGGLVDAASFRGRDSILSGPAGGVIALQHIGSTSPACGAIGFDMGGTSTDVSRVYGEPEVVFERTVAGTRIATPMVAIETVAAGGGSICRFDGVALQVGPNSAGAAPGPACYGAGGPLCVTDLNVFLGRVPESRFPFPLDHDAVRIRLEELADDVASGTGARPALDALAGSLLRVANAMMVRPVRTISPLSMIIRLSQPTSPCSMPSTMLTPFS